MFHLFRAKTEFTKNVITLLMGSIVAQAIPIALSPILTRIYTPEDFGVFALYMSISALFTTFATGRYELAIMLPKKEGDAMYLVILSLLITVVMTLFSLFVIIIFETSIITFFDTPFLSRWLYFIPISVFVAGLYQSFVYWHNRQKAYEKMAIGKVTQSAAAGMGNIGMGVMGFASGGLVLGNLLGQIASTYVLGHSFLNASKPIVLRRRIKLLAFMKKYRKFPLLNLPNALIDSFRLSGINILIAKYFTTATLGQFSLAWKMVQVPMALIGSSVGQVFFQEVSSASKSALYGIIIQYIKKASLLAAPVFLLVYLFSEPVFGFVFGKGWFLAGEAASVMAPWLFVNFVTSPLVSVMLVLHKQEWVLLFSVLYMFVPLGLIVMSYDDGFLSVLRMMTVCMSVMLVLFGSLIVYEAKKYV